jgi:hypothetical protein
MTDDLAALREALLQVQFAQPSPVAAGLPARRTPMTDQLSSKLHNTTDAMEWTEEFDRLFPDRRPDSGTMLGWFANAIEVGRVAGERAVIARLSAEETQP